MVKINGNFEENTDGQRLDEYLKNRGFKKNRIAVELNGDIVPRADYENYVLKDGDVLEVVSFVGGG